MGNLYRHLGRLDQAEAAFHRALELSDQLCHTHPEVDGYQHGLATNQMNLAYFYSGTGRPNEALSGYRKAQNVWKELARRTPDNLDFQVGLAKVSLNLGVLYAQVLGRHFEA